jgi:glutathione peroxidase-family protein
MKKTFLLCALTALLTLTGNAQEIYNFQVTNDEGKQVELAQYKGKVMLIVNTATRCGFTPQYNELEALFEKYRDKGLEILDFPCNQFGEQAPGSIEEIHQFCTANFNIQFPQFDKIEVNGPNEHPLYTYLKAQKPFGGFDLNDKTGKLLDDMFKKNDPNYAQSPSIKWNFTKFLVNQKGNVVKRYEPTDKIADIDADICALLNKKCCQKGEEAKCCKKDEDKKGCKKGEAAKCGETK